MDDQGRYTILHLCEHFGGKKATFHGVARLFQWWMPNFDATRFRVLLCSRRRWDKATDEMQASGITPLTLGYGKLDPRNLFALIRLVRKERIDLIHAHGYGACTWGRIAGWLMRIPVIVHEHCNYHTVPLPQRPAEWMLAPLTAHTFATSESVRQFCIHKRYLKPEGVETLYNGILVTESPAVDSEWIAQLRCENGVPEGALLMGVVGRIEGHKGLIDAMRALQLVLKTNPNVRLWIVGDGAYENEVCAFISENKLGEVVRMLGFRRDVRKVIQAFDLQVFPSHEEATPNTLFEAMVAGLPAVATTADGQGEVLEHEKTALLCEPGEIERLATNMKRMLDDSELRKRLAHNLHGLVKKFDGHATIRRMEDVYVQLLKK